jgi:hypothetical protein
MGGPAGLWRAGQDDGLYWTLLIDESGTGWIECGRRPDYESITEFAWTVSGPDRVEFVFGACREVEDTGPAPVQLGANARTNRTPTSPAM